LCAFLSILFTCYQLNLALVQTLKRLIMKAKYRDILVELTALLYILLFVYAAVSKLLDFENFKVQIGQSSMLSAFAGWLVWVIPLLEIFIAVGLSFRASRLPALFAAFSLMVMFSAYIFIVLNYSSFIPCSCGGILEKLGWREHLWFNIFFALLAAVSLVVMYQPKKQHT